MDSDNTPKTQSGLAAFIPSSSSASRTIEAEFKGVRFTIRHITRTQLFALSQNCTTLVFDKNTKQRGPKLDFQKFAKAFASAIVVGWSGLTLRTLQNFMLLDNISTLTKEQLDAPIPFTEENLELLIANASGLDEFLQEAAMEAENFRVVPPADLAKNS